MLSMHLIVAARFTPRGITRPRLSAGAFFAANCHLHFIVVTAAT
jgi:hypothetical protein